jgi:hypothetical protein
VDAILSLAQTQRVVLTMRADFWGECATYPDLKEKMLAHQELIAPMTTSRLRSAVEHQAAKVGLRFDADFVNTVLNEVAGEPGAMALLQHALLEMWKRRHGKWLRTKEYRAIGGVRRAIAETADRVYEGLSPAEQRQVREIFLRLTHIDQSFVRGEDRRDTRRRLSLSELAPANGDLEGLRALVVRLADAALLVTSYNQVTEQEEIQVAHEALIRHWKRLRSWLDENLANLRLRETISDAAKEWDKHRTDNNLLVHQGGRLAAIQEALKKGRLSLNSLEEEYVFACKRFQKDELRDARRRVRLAYSAVTLMVVLLLISLAVGLLAKWNADMLCTERDRARIMQSRLLAERSRNASESQNFGLGVALALEGTQEGGAEPDRPYTYEPEANLYRAVSENRERSILPHKGLVNFAMLSSDGLRALTASKNKTAQIWDVRTGARIVACGVDRGTDHVLFAAFTPKGAVAATRADDHTVRLWTLPPNAQTLIEDAKRAAPRCLTSDRRKEFLLLSGPPKWCIDLGKYPYVQNGQFNSTH